MQQVRKLIGDNRFSISHIENLHVVAKPNICNECEDRFKLKEIFLVILESYNCNKCEDKFSNKEELSSHINDLHVLVKPYDCNKCEDNSKIEEELSSHMQTMVKHYNCNKFFCR